MASPTTQNGAGTQINAFDSYKNLQRSTTVSHSMRLNFDILFLVMDQLWLLRDVRSMMLTCNTLYNYGIPRLFTAQLRVTKRNIASFCLFMMRDLSRCEFITRMQFLFWRLPEPLGTQMTTILHHASKLSEVIIDAKCLDIDPRIPTALSALPSLEDVQINGFCTDAGRVFRSAKGPVKFLDVEPLDNEGGPSDFIEILSGIRASLERLVLRITSWQENNDIVYPALRYLIIWNPYECIVRPLINSLPNLRELHVGIAEEEGIDDPLGWIDDFDAERDANIQDQILRGSWAQLETLRGDLNLLYAMGITCHVHNLHLRLEGPKFDGVEFARFRGVVESSQPDYLLVRVTDLNILHLRAIILQVAVLGVRKFHIAVSVPEGENHFTPLDFTKFLFQLIGHFGDIQMLEIELSWRDNRTGQSYSWWDSDEDEDEDENDLYIDSEDEDAMDTSTDADAAPGTEEQPDNHEESAIDEQSTPGSTPGPTTNPDAPTEPEAREVVGKHHDQIFMENLPVEVLAKAYFETCPELQYLRLCFSCTAIDGTSYNSGQWKRSEDGEDFVDIKDQSWITVTGMNPI